MLLAVSLSGPRTFSEHSQSQCPEITSKVTGAACETREHFVEQHQQQRCFPLQQPFSVLPAQYCCMYNTVQYTMPYLYTNVYVRGLSVDASWSFAFNTINNEQPLPNLLNITVRHCTGSHGRLPGQSGIFHCKTIGSAC